MAPFVDVMNTQIWGELKGNSRTCRLKSCDSLSPSRWVSPVVSQRRRARCSPQIAAVGLCATNDKQRFS